MSAVLATLTFPAAVLLGAVVAMAAIEATDRALDCVHMWRVKRSYRR